MRQVTAGLLVDHDGLSLQPGCR